MSLRALLNAGDANRLADAARAIGLGDVLNLLLPDMTFTETGVVPASNVATLAAQPATIFDVVATAETGGTHTKTLLRGPISGAKAVVPAAGQCVWDGGTKVLFNSVDAVTAVKFLYSKTTDTTISLFQRELGQNDVAV